MTRYARGSWSTDAGGESGARAGSLGAGRAGGVATNAREADSATRCAVGLVSARGGESDVLLWTVWWAKTQVGCRCCGRGGREGG